MNITDVSDAMSQMSRHGPGRAHGSTRKRKKSPTSTASTIARTTTGSLSVTCGSLSGIRRARVGAAPCAPIAQKSTAVTLGTVVVSIVSPVRLVIAVAGVYVAVLEPLTVPAPVTVTNVIVSTVWPTFQAQVELPALPLLVKEPLLPRPIVPNVSFVPLAVSVSGFAL